MVEDLMSMNEFVIFTGPMFGGKTTKLLSVIDRYFLKKTNIMCFKPGIDSRYGEDHINTHNGGKIPAIRVSHGLEISRHVMDTKPSMRPSVVAVDEAFMIPGCAQALIAQFKQGRTVLVSSLQLASSGESLEEVQSMMPFATKIEICPAVCTICGADAYYTTKTGGRPEQEVEVGGLELYQPRCFKHFDKFGG